MVQSTSMGPLTGTKEFAQLHYPMTAQEDEALRRQPVGDIVGGGSSLN
jgi:hypothetical protein